MTVVPFLRLVRLPNLIIIAFTQCTMRWLLIGPMLAVNDIALQQGTVSFLLLVLSTVLIAAAGYIVNDYFDADTDALNRPHRKTIGAGISGDAAMNIYFGFNIAAVAIGFYLAWEADRYNLGLIQVISAGLLWFYSTSFKRQFLTGNLVVAFLSALVPLTAGLYEALHEIAILNGLWFNFRFIAGYAAFAFALTMVREIIKDMEDVRGDLSAGCSTLPVVMGIPAAKGLAVTLTLAVMAGLGYIQRMQYGAGDGLSFWYFAVALQLPLLCLLYLTVMAGGTRAFRRASLLSKGIMVTGVLYTVIVSYSLRHAY